MGIHQAGNFIDLMGKTFGRLTVTKRLANDWRGQSVWKCVCVCGNTTTVGGWNLRNGLTKSCWCLKKETAIKMGAGNVTHGHWKGGTPTPEWTIWTAMKNRCLNKRHRQYRNYGGRGITVCKRWMRFEHFFADMGRRPEGRGRKIATYSIERINNNKGYHPKNCKWATAKEQCDNRRRNTHCGRRHLMVPENLYYSAGKRHCRACRAFLNNQWCKIHRPPKANSARANHR